LGSTRRPVALAAFRHRPQHHSEAPPVAGTLLAFKRNRGDHAASQSRAAATMSMTANHRRDLPRDRMRLKAGTDRAAMLRTTANDKSDTAVPPCTASSMSLGRGSSLRSSARPLIFETGSSSAHACKHGAASVLPRNGAKRGLTILENDKVNSA